MTARYMLDTNIVSYLLKVQHPPLRQRVAALAPGELCISAVTHSELVYGLHLNPQASRIHPLVQDFLGRVSTLDWTAATARRHGALRAQYQRQGLGFGALDLMIAAHAISENACLVSNDRAFTRIEGLRLENWVTE